MLLLSQKCYGASIEYMLGTEDSEQLYKDSDEDVADNNNAYMDARRNVDDSDDKDPEFEKIVFADASDIVYYDNSKITRNSDNVDSTTEYIYDNDNTTADIQNQTITPNISETNTRLKVELRPEQIIHEYHYDYADSDAPNYIIQKGKNLSLHHTTQDNVLVTNKTFDTFSELFNLESVAENLYFNSTPENLLHDTWYILEDYPCWQLPLIYGEIDQTKSQEFEFGTQKRRTPVFQMYRKYLKNVITENDTVEESVQKIDDIQYNVNKWCRVAPCYGDHTMCMFPGKVASGFCGRGYTVSVPAVNEQIAFIFSLNSIRNAVASGDRSHHHPHLPHVRGATNMRKVLYDYELQLMAKKWLLQCLPGPAPCDSLDNAFVTQLECTKLTDHCCMDKHIVTKWYSTQSYTGIYLSVVYESVLNEYNLLFF